MDAVEDVAAAICETETRSRRGWEGWTHAAQAAISAHLQWLADNEPTDKMMQAAQNYIADNQARYGDPYFGNKEIVELWQAMVAAAQEDKP